MAKRISILLAAMTALTFAPQTAEACTGITLTAKDNAHVVARTIECPTVPLRHRPATSG